MDDAERKYIHDQFSRLERESDKRAWFFSDIVLDRNYKEKKRTHIIENPVGRHYRENQ